MDFEEFIRRLRECNVSIETLNQLADIAVLWNDLIDNGIKIPLVKKEAE